MIPRDHRLRLVKFRQRVDLRAPRSLDLVIAFERNVLRAETRRRVLQPEVDVGPNQRALPAASAAVRAGPLLPEANAAAVAVGQEPVDGGRAVHGLLEVKMVASVDVEVLEGLKSKWRCEVLDHGSVNVIMMRLRAETDAGAVVIYDSALVAPGGHVVVVLAGESLASFLQYALHVLSLSLNSQL